MQKRIVKLKVSYVHANGGGNFPGETVSLPADVAERLVGMGQATWHETIAASRERATEVPSPVTRAPVTKPGVPADLKGFAKMNWLRKAIVDAGQHPDGRTLAALEQQYGEL